MILTDAGSPVVLWRASGIQQRMVQGIVILATYLDAPTGPDLCVANPAMLEECSPGMVR